MAEFGWAYVAGDVISGALGPVDSLLLKKGDTNISGSPNLVYNTTSNVLAVTGGVSASVNISASAFYGDGSNLSGITSVNIANDGNNRLLTADGDSTMSAESNLTFDGSNLILSGNLEVSGSRVKLTGLSAGTATTSSFLAVDSSNNIVLTSSAAGGGSGGTLGAAEDGDYTDGLYTDFTTNTTVGTAIDRFNEVLKILAPSPAPNVKSIKYDQSNGQSAKLSFDGSNAITGYTASSTNAGFSAVNRNGTYEAATSGANFKLGIYNAQELTGFINYDVAPSVTNGQVAYASGAFGNANEGTLKLELNGTVIHSVALSGLAGSGNPATGSATSLTNGSGFTNVSITASSFDGNAAEWHIFKHRTAKYKIEADDQKKGWNYLRVVHTVGGADRNSNYIEWINDPDGAGQALSISNARIENISTGGSVYVSGVQYNTSITANYKADINNIYRNVFPTGTPISFSPTKSSTPSAQAVPDLSGGDDETKVLGITASLSLNTSINPSQTIGSSMSVTHPLKSNITNGGNATATQFLIYDNTPPTSNNLTETFINETFRVVSASYDTQGSLSSATWDSEVHLTSSGTSGYNDGLVQLATAEYNGRLYSPIASALPNNGNFSTLTNGPAGNPNYSSESGTRAYYRKIQNTSGGTKYNLKITSTKGSTTYNNSSLSTGNAHFFAKIPGATGWMDISQNFVYGSVADGNGALISSATNDVDSGNNVHHITFGTASIAANEYIAIKVLADESWTGHLSQLEFVLGASSETAATPQVLSDIDANDTGTGAKLSFGSSNAVAGYSNVQGGGIGSMTTINSNGDYTVSGNRRGVFSAAPTIDGEINDAIAADGGSDYPAKAFYNAYSGSLILEVNGSEVHTINLASTLSAINTTNSPQNSRLNVSAVSFAETSDGIPDYLKPYRTGTFEVGSANQRSGWNYARLIHRTNSDATTNYVEWVVDPSGAVDNTAVTSPALANFNHGDIYYQSGVRYFASRPSASFTYAASNFYSNVYSNESDAISFERTDNCSINNIRMIGDGITTFDSGVSQAGMAALDNGADCEATSFEVTGNVLFDNLTSISGGLGLYTKYDIAVNSTIKHPFKTNKTTSTASKTAFMVYSGSIGSTTLGNNEYFGLETYRVVSGNYANQAAVIDAGNVWNSQTALNGGDSHDDGMVTANGYAISPFQIGNAGDTRNSADGGSLQAPAGSPNYSTLTNNTRTFYRYFRYTDASTVASFTLTLYGDANLVGKTGTYAAALGSNKNCFVELKVPFDPNFPGADDQSTDWADCAKIFEASAQPNVLGAGIRAGSFSGEDQSIDSNGLALSLTLGTRRIKQNQYIMIKISAHKDWTGYLSRIQVTY